MNRTKNRNTDNFISRNKKGQKETHDRRWISLYICVCSINQYIHHCDSGPGWHVIDLLRWMQSADWVIVVLLRISP